MALSDSALSELAEVFRTGEGTDFIRECVRVAMQELIDAEATAAIGAGRYERTESRVTERNGSRPRLLTTHAGDVQLAIPKLRAGSFFPSILSPRRRIDQALYAVVMEAYVHGVSTRSVDDLVIALGGTAISKSEVSRICAGLDEAVGAFRTRRLDHTTFPYVYLDATYLHVRTEHAMVTSKAVVVATAVTADGRREVLGLDVGDSEDEVFWRGFLTGSRHERVRLASGREGQVLPSPATLPELASSHVSTSVSLVALGCGGWVARRGGGQHCRRELVQHLDVLRAAGREVRRWRSKPCDRRFARQLPAVGSRGADIPRRRCGRLGERVAAPNRRRASRTARGNGQVVLDIARRGKSGRRGRARPGVSGS